MYISKLSVMKRCPLLGVFDSTVVTGWFYLQVTEENDLTTEQERVVEQEVEPVGVVSAPAEETNTVQELNNLSIELPVARQQPVEATNQISDDVLVQGTCVQEDTQTLTNQVTAEAMDVQSTAPLLVAEERECDPLYPQLESLIAG